MQSRPIPLNAMDSQLDAFQFKLFFQSLIETPDLFQDEAVKIAQALLNDISQNDPIVNYETRRMNTQNLFAALHKAMPNHEELLDKWGLQISYRLYLRDEALATIDEAIKNKPESKSILEKALNNDEFIQQALTGANKNSYKAINNIYAKKCENDISKLRNQLRENLNTAYDKSMGVLETLKGYFSKDTFLGSDAIKELKDEKLALSCYSQFNSYQRDNKGKRLERGATSAVTQSVIELTELYYSKTYLNDNIVEDKHRLTDDFAKQRIFFGLMPFSSVRDFELNLRRILHVDIDTIKRYIQVDHNKIQEPVTQPYRPADSSEYQDLQLNPLLQLQSKRKLKEGYAAGGNYDHASQYGSLKLTPKPPASSRDDSELGAPDRESNSDQSAPYHTFSSSSSGTLFNRYNSVPEDKEEEQELKHPGKPKQ